MRLFSTLAALLFVFNLSAHAEIGGRFDYRYELTANGPAPTQLSVEGWDANLARDCRTDPTSGVTHCAGKINALIIIPLGSIFMRGSVATTGVKLTVSQKCARKGEYRAISELPSEIDSNPIEGLFYEKIDANLNPCGYAI